MKEEGYEHWRNPNEGATNESKFTALPAGWSCDSGDLGRRAYIWTASKNSNDAFVRTLNYQSSELSEEDYYYQGDGFSVRCVKD